MLRSLSLLLIALGSLPAEANSTFDLTIKEETVTYRLNSNEITCDPGQKHGFQLPTTISMSVPYPMFGYEDGGRNYVSSNVHSVGLSAAPERCDLVSRLVNQTNPSWRLADAKRVVKERYYRVSNARCDKSLVEELTVVIQGEPDLKFTGTYGFFIESLPVSRCHFDVEK
jgi:hypothetical protein